MNNTEKKIEGRVITAFFYTIFILIGIILYGYTQLNGAIIYSTSKILFNVLFAVVPVVILYLPFVFHGITGKFFGDCVKRTMAVSLAWLVLLFGASLGLKFCFRTFTPEKWERFMYNRYLMIEDMESQYDLIGMTYSEVEAILGTNYTQGNYGTDREFNYLVSNEFWTSHYYSVRFKDGVVEETCLIKGISSI